MKRNTAKEKAKNNKGFPYKHRAICTKCGKKYGYDRDKDDGVCPYCCGHIKIKTKEYWTNKKNVTTK